MNALEFLGITTEHISTEKVILKMTLWDNHLQPYGIMHGGISALLIETATSMGANEYLDNSKRVAMGIDIQTNHIRTAKKGEVLSVVATPDHIGNHIHVWQATVYNQQEQKISVGRCTLMIKNLTP